MNIQHLKNIREYELNQIIPLIPQSSSILEIGAGSGWQVKILAEHGFAVEAIDIDTEQSPYTEHRVWPVRSYDGVHIPFDENSFDVVFSSCVLEHILNFNQIQSEIKRVLKPNGLAIHILPTSTWRFWSNISYYFAGAKKILFMILAKMGAMNAGADQSICKPKETQKSSKLAITKNLLKIMVPPCHGVVGNCISEIYLFNRFRWISLFRGTGWQVQSYKPNRLFYTGYSFFGPLFTLRLRRLLSYILGSTCIIYVLTPQNKKNV